MSGQSRGRVGAVITGGALALSLTLAGCSGGGDEPGTDASASTSPSASESPSESASALPVPSRIDLTEQGSELALGETATVAYRPNQKKVGVLDIEVKDLRKTSFKESFAGWKLSAQVKKSAPYFVTATFKNVGDTDLGGLRPPLYVVDGDDTLVESTSFKGDFKPCGSAAFPKKFAQGDKVLRCLVYLVPDGGTLVAASFRPDQDYSPITWTGKVLALGVERDSGKASGKASGKGSGKGSGRGSGKGSGKGSKKGQ
ncbi:hypothetical protein [Nocardioides acrostichi]|uniref:Uncharacterized protein n=1 Tax=Nocardioides acrostichi TaxID=2784339 RepID=A0A930UYV4_9ACTN|nr:hypothetical protein [Nocardioides acrostichi]MBF4163413.1 hypothetical protein [Nocardioides acrostichi]